MGVNNALPFLGSDLSGILILLRFYFSSSTSPLDQMVFKGFLVFLLPMASPLRLPPLLRHQLLFCLVQSSVFKDTLNFRWPSDTVIRICKRLVMQMSLCCLSAMSAMSFFFFFMHRLWNLFWKFIHFEGRQWAGSYTISLSLWHFGRRKDACKPWAHAVCVQRTECWDSCFSPCRFLAWLLVCLNVFCHEKVRCFCGLKQSPLRTQAGMSALGWKKEPFWKLGTFKCIQDAVSVTKAKWKTSLTQCQEMSPTLRFPGEVYLDRRYFVSFCRTMAPIQGLCTF